MANRWRDDRRDVIVRFAGCGLGPTESRADLADLGDALHGAASGGEPAWADGFGGFLGVALLAAEVRAPASHLNSRTSGVRSLAVNALLDHYSAVTVAGKLGVSRQKVYDIARSGLRGPYLDHVPWRQTKTLTANASHSPVRRTNGWSIRSISLLPVAIFARRGGSDGSRVRR